MASNKLSHCKWLNRFIPHINAYKLASILSPKDNTWKYKVFFSFLSDPSLGVFSDRVRAFFKFVGGCNVIVNCCILGSRCQLILKHQRLGDEFVLRKPCDTWASMFIYNFEFCFHVELYNFAANRFRDYLIFVRYLFIYILLTKFN